ncbi:hypothetical protein GGS21DRAFT_263127 [Xylaria nigripes]|nr:hypothetical protein GGS21DRAFT_263127 [Xylaria nigripes]
MALIPQAGVNHLTPTSSNGNTTPRSPGVRLMLPNRAVTSDTIEDAYVNFILHCNPAVPLDVDTTSLREAFRTPPKSEGKSFSTFTLFGLITKLHQKEIKTWAELALRLGVEPPDHEKGQSSQKIQQYAVRLKRWMHSMHVNAFFDYLLDNPHPYWMQIPMDNNPVCEEGRDGVAAEDDMALRALLPHIRPRRGRKRPEDDGMRKSPSQKPRLESPGYNMDSYPSRPESLNSWTSHPDSSQAFGFPAHDSRPNVISGSECGYAWQQQDFPRESMTAYPQSAITPTNNSAFWPTDAAEPRSAMSPKSKPLGRRHGAKAVSSAWRSIGVSASGKARGRPPMLRNYETPLSTYPDRSVNDSQPMMFDNNHHSGASTPMLMGDSEPMVRTPDHTSSQSGTPSRPGRLSLQVPERPSGCVRLATPPPPVVMVNGRNTLNGSESNHQEMASAASTTGAAGAASTSTNSSAGAGAEVGNSQPTTIFDRTAMYLNADNPAKIDKIDIDGPNKMNHDEVESIFVVTLSSCSWFDGHGQPGPRPTVAEVVALVRTVINSIAEQALTKEAFLINLAALVGGHFMIRPEREVHRLEVAADYTKYMCKWNLTYGSVTGTFSLTETVPHSKWKPGHQSLDQPLEKGQMPSTGIPAAEYWQQQYANLAVTSIRRLDSLTIAKTNALRLLKGTPDVDAHRYM